MSKRNREFTESKYDKWLKEGRGQGEGGNYKPWINIQDVPSKGRSTRVMGIKSGRQHQFLSDMETNYFYILEYLGCVYDIREQYPLLSIEQTLHIADEIGINHHTDPKSKEKIVITTDFLITVSKKEKNYLIARTIKSANELNNLRVLEKFEIERRYWEKKEVDWGIVTENEINKTFSENIKIIHPFYRLVDKEVFYGYSDIEISEFSNKFKERIIGNKINIRKSAKQFDEDMMLKHGASIALFKHLLITKQIHIDLYTPLNIDMDMDVSINNVFGSETYEQISCEYCYGV